MQIRAFVAVEFAGDVISRLTSLIGELRKTAADVRWVRPEGLHLTLKFLGNIREDQVAEVLQGLSRELRCHTCLRLDARGIGAFPSLKRPRVIWVACHSQDLAALATATEDCLAGLGFAREKRPFKAHVTLGRVRSRRNWEALERELCGRAAQQFGESEVRDVVLFRSQLTPQGARYSRLGAVKLAGNES